MDGKLYVYTISELIAKSIFENDDCYLNEVKNRLYYCGFSPNVIDDIIQKELKLVNENKIQIISSRIIDNKFNINTFKANKNKIMLSELLAIIDESIMIRKFFSHNYDENTINQIEQISSEDLNNFLMKEFYDRIESAFRDANNLKLKFRGYVYEEQIGKLYENEMAIIVKNRWSNFIDTTFKIYGGIY